MAQGEFTKEEATATEEALTQVMDGLTKKQKMEFFGHFNDIMLFVSAAKAAAPSEKKKPKSQGKH